MRLEIMRMRSPQFGHWHTDDDPADHRKQWWPGNPRLGWDLRDQPPAEEPVTVYKLSPEEIAARYGPPRPRPPMVPRLTLALLQQLADQGLTVAEIAEQFKRPAVLIRAAAQKWGVMLLEEKPMAEQKTEQPAEKWPVGPERLKELFLHRQLKQAEIAAMYGVSVTAVNSALGRYGIRRKARSTSPPAYDKAEEAAPTRVTAQLNETRTHLAAVQVTGVMQAPCACRVLDSIAKLIETNPLMARVSVELQIRAAGE